MSRSVTQSTQHSNSAASLTPPLPHPPVSTLKQDDSAEAVPNDMRADWREWAASAIGGDAQSIDAATDAILAALIRGASVEEAVAVGHVAAADPTAAQNVKTQDQPLTHPVSDDQHLRGVVSSFRQRSELMGTQYGTVWDFRMDHWNAAGKPAPPVAVELRGFTFLGSIADGDWVEIVGGAPRLGEILQRRTVFNLSMNSTVTVDGGDPKKDTRSVKSRAPAAPGLGRRVLAAVLIGVLLWLVFVALNS